MAVGRARVLWEPICAVLALLANVFRDESKHPKPFTPGYFQPYGRKKKQAEPKHPRLDIRALKTVFVDRRNV